MRKNILIFLFFGLGVEGQELHHQMISTQGCSKLLPSGIIVRQTIGQQSVLGNYKANNFVVGQGFQQNIYSRYTINKIPTNVKTITYPNPISDFVNFKFSSPINGPIKISFFDLLGRLVFYEEKQANNDVLSIHNIYLAEGEYLVKLTAQNYNYSTKILKLR